VKVFKIQDPVSLEQMSGQDIVDAIVKELKGILMPQDMSKPPGTIVHMSEDELMTRPQHAMVVPAKPSAEEFARDFDTYIAIQRAIDERMPDSIMDIQGKPFRKKSYWRAVATAFNLSVKPTSDEYFETTEDWGYKIVYVATAPSGRDAYGDGTCMHSDKRVYDWDYTKKPRVRLGVNKLKTEDNATHHNVRGHAHTRAYNRAVSNLVGFGEVSAEEMPMGDRLQNPPDRAHAAERGSSKASGGPWDGKLDVTFGKYKKGAKEGGKNGKKWGDLPSHYLEWILSDKCDMDVAKDMAAKETGRRALLEAAKKGKGDTVDAEIVEPTLPLDEPDHLADEPPFDDRYDRP
jgi:hypothetical protein